MVHPQGFQPGGKTSPAPQQPEMVYHAELSLEAMTLDFSRREIRTIFPCKNFPGEFLDVFGESKKKSTIKKGLDTIEWWEYLGNP